MVQLKEVEYMGREKVKQWWMAPGGGTALPEQGEGGAGVGRLGRQEGGGASGLCPDTL